MSEFSRLLESSASPDLRAVLNAGLADAPRADALPRVAAALGLTAGAVVVAIPAAAAASTGLASASSATAAATLASNAGAVSSAVAAGSAAKVPAVSGLTLLALSKWLAAGAVAGAIVAGGVSVLERASPATRKLPSPAIPSPSTSNPPPSRPAPRVLLNPVPEAPVGPEPVVAPSDDASSLHGVPSPVAAPLPQPASRALAVEAARIDAARRALANGELERALAELDAYQRERELGVLDREARILRIQVLVARGDRERAVVLARSYLVAHPNDAHAPRLRALVANGGSAWPNVEGIDGAAGRH